MQVLLARCQMDTDDEVRDRATYYYSILEKQDKALANRYIVEGLQVSRNKWIYTYMASSYIC
jgi:coatomer protein complex subunit gamma